MFDSALAFARYRLEVVKSWPDGLEKSVLLEAIESSLRREEEERNGRQSGTPRAFSANPERDSRSAC